MPKWLLVDADDTLWENNIYFERVIERFIAHLAHPHLTHAEVRDVINEIEKANAKVHGYGTASFTRNLQEAFGRLAPARTAELEEVAALARVITEHPIELIEGVRDTLDYLSSRHRLVLFTKGDPTEQNRKVDRSGVGGYFTQTRVVKEKEAASYRAMVGELQAEPHEVWMIGNSPKSDINPALEAGLNAVWVPHDATWVLEHEEVRPGNGKLLVLSRFTELRDHF
jgi:putative hydrolase of the HAD superfamily